MTINRLFDLLDEWRMLPAYQLERRADIFFALYLDKIIEELRNSKIEMIIPEFPVRVGDVDLQIKEINRSFKIDYLAYSKTEQRVFLIELKTDQRSLREKQDWYLENSAKLRVSGLMSGLIKIHKATKQKNKYNKLLDKLETIDWIKRSDKKIENLNCLIEPEVIYIQPLNRENRKNVISFDDVISVLSGIEDPIAKRFKISLNEWKLDTNL